MPNIQCPGQVAADEGDAGRFAAFQDRRLGVFGEMLGGGRRGGGEDGGRRRQANGKGKGGNRGGRGWAARKNRATGWGGNKNNNPRGVVYSPPPPLKPAAPLPALPGGPAMLRLWGPASAAGRF